MELRRVDIILVKIACIPADYIGMNRTDYFKKARSGAILVMKSKGCMNSVFVLTGKPMNLNVTFVEIAV